MLRHMMAAAGLTAMLAVTAQAQVLSFDDVPGATTIGGAGVVIGTAYDALGVEFVGDARAFCLNRTENPSCSNTSWGSGPLADAARARNTHAAGMYWISGSPIMNRADGFTTGFSFFYSNPFAVTSAFEVWSDLNATGSLLGSFSLLGTNNGAGDPGCFGANYCSFEVGSVAFAGTARSVRFTGGANQIAYDDITFGSTDPGVPVPEPATLAMLGMGLFGLAGAARRRRA